MRYVLLAMTLTSTIAATPPAAGQAIREITYLSRADKTLQPAMFYAPATEERVPLIVALHTWSGDYRQRGHQRIAEWCLTNGWAFLHPNFRGPNDKPEATGSQLVVDDIVSGVEHALEAAPIDPGAVYLVGTSGGGYTALLMAGRHPGLWAGVSAWVPISDLKAWYDQNRYRDSIVKSCGGPPGTSAAVDEEYRLRSPLTYLASAKGVNLHIQAGIHDGHTGSVPVSHSLLAFNAVAEPADRLAPEEIRYFVEQRAVPEPLRRDITDPAYGAKRPLFRRTSGTATVTIFEGGHELVAEAAIACFRQLEAARQKRR